MNSIVLELQRGALDSSVKVSDLLRKALVVATKLKIGGFEKWINQELDGYKSEDDIPDYRTVDGEIKVWNPFHGWQPVLFDDDDTHTSLTRRRSNQPISEIEALLSNNQGGQYTMKFSAETELNLMRHIGAPTPPVLHVSAAKLFGILDKVRNIVLNWSLKLETDGILGDELTFTTEERRVAQRNVYNVNNFYGNVNNPQIQQTTSDSAVVVQSDIQEISEFIKRLKEEVPKLELGIKNEKRIKNDINHIERQLNSKQPKISLIKESLKSIGRILEGMVGNTLGTALFQILTNILAKRCGL